VYWNPALVARRTAARKGGWVAYGGWLRRRRRAGGRNVIVTVGVAVNSEGDCDAIARSSRRVRHEVLG